MLADRDFRLYQLKMVVALNAVPFVFAHQEHSYFHLLSKDDNPCGRIILSVPKNNLDNNFRITFRNIIIQNEDIQMETYYFQFLYSTSKSIH